MSTLSKQYNLLLIPLTNKKMVTQSCHKHHSASNLKITYLKHKPIKYFNLLFHLRMVWFGRIHVTYQINLVYQLKYSRNHLC